MTLLVGVLRVATYGRSSGDEEGTGQDVRAQVAETDALAQADGLEVVASFVDDGVSSETPPLERDGFAAAVECVESGNADAIAVPRFDRYDRRDKVTAVHDWHVLRRCGVPVISLTQPVFDPRVVDPDDENMDWPRLAVAEQGRGQLVLIRSATQAAMTAIKEGRRPTKSGKANGRPQKVTRQDVEDFYPLAVQRGTTYAARGLSVAKGWRADQDRRTQKKYWVPHTTLITAFQRENRLTGGFPWPPCVENPDVSETVSDMQGETCGGKGPVSDATPPLQNSAAKGAVPGAPAGDGRPDVDEKEAR